MTRKSFLAIIATGSVICVTACSSLGGGATGGSTANSKSDITIALPSEPLSFDGCDSQSQGTVTHGNITEGLTTVDANGDVKPLLATSWKQVDKTSWTFILRKGVKFQDGTPLSPDAVVSSIKRLMNPKLVCESLEQFTMPVTATASGPDTVTIKTQGLDAILPLRMSFADIVAPSTPPNKKTNNVIGTGPYKIAKLIHGQSIKLTRYNGYWGPKPQVTSATFVYRTDPSVRASMIKTGEADVALQIAPQDASTDGTTQEFDADDVLWFRMPTNRAPFNDIRVRKAAEYALDKKTITSKLMQHVGRPYDQLLSRNVNSYIPGYHGPGYDPAKAKSLLKAAAADGVKVDTEFDLVSRESIMPGTDEVMQAVAQNLEDVGFKVRLRSLDDDAWLKVLRAPFATHGDPSMIAIPHDNTTGDASFSYPKYLQSTGPNSTVHDKVIDNLLTTAAAANGAQRTRYYQEASQEEYKNVVSYIPFAELTSLVMVSPHVQFTANALTDSAVPVAEMKIK